MTLILAFLLLTSAFSGIHSSSIKVHSEELTASTEEETDSAKNTTKLPETLPNEEMTTTTTTTTTTTAIPLVNNLNSSVVKRVFQSYLGLIQRNPDDWMKQLAKQISAEYQRRKRNQSCTDEICLYRLHFFEDIKLSTDLNVEFTMESTTTTTLSPAPNSSLVEEPVLIRKARNVNPTQEIDASPSDIPDQVEIDQIETEIPEQVAEEVPVETVIEEQETITDRPEQVVEEVTTIETEEVSQPETESSELRITGARCTDLNLAEVMNIFMAMKQSKCSMKEIRRKVLLSIA
ncbi:hypothetical protein Ciccas_010893 [Cichlidogyrus casuarinus]|uniref:Uncharacterized protein n=1 Tax=Cichlidogyrus casuarinus TaxID=1844966 RepID=A0ABD2PVR4_9PLAT